MTLTEFLLARIAEDEDAAKVRTVSRRMISGKMVDIPMHNAPGRWAWSPDRVLAECEARRRIVEDCVEFDDESTSGAALGHRVLRSLALPYADHLDYDEAWRA